MTSSYPLTVLRNNDVTVELTFMEADASVPTPYTFPPGTDVEFYIKASEATVDGAATAVLTLSGGDVEIVDRERGTCRVAIPAEALLQAGTFWYHVDAVGAGGTPRRTGSRGKLVVKAV